MSINWNAFEKNAESSSQAKEIDAQYAEEQSNDKEAAPRKKTGRPPKGGSYHYSRVALEPDVWQAMKYKKLMGDESYTDQINNAMRLYLDLKR